MTASARRFQPGSTRTQMGNDAARKRLSTALFLALLCVLNPHVDARKLLGAEDSAAGAGAAPVSAAAPLVESYACIASGVMLHPCWANPATVFAPGFTKLNTSSVADRAYQAIQAQHVLCRHHGTQASCQAATSASLYCSWDSLNARCVPDQYASLLLPLSCPGSKLHTMMACGRAGLINACSADPACTLGAQSRCYPRWLVDEARDTRQDEQAIAEHAAVAILQGDASMLGSCPQAQLLQKILVACPFQAGWDTCDTNVCEFSTPHFLPARPQSLHLPNMTADGAGTQPLVEEAAAQLNGSSSSSSDVDALTLLAAAPFNGTNFANNTSGGLAYYGAYPSPVCFPDVFKTPMVLHTLLGVSEGLAAHMAAAHAACEDTDDVVMDVALGVEGCGFARLSFNIEAALKVVGVHKKPVAAGGSNSSSSSSGSGPGQGGGGGGAGPGPAAVPAPAVPAAAPAPAAVPVAKAVPASAAAPGLGSSGVGLGLPQQQKPAHVVKPPAHITTESDPQSAPPRS